MKALVMDSFGGPEKLHWAEVPTPVPAANEVLVQIAYAGLNPVDWKIADGHLQKMLPHHFPLILGWDAAGTITQVGKDVKTWKAGDKVFAYCRKPAVQWGTYAEYITLEAGNVAKAPSNLTFAQAAGVPLVALTAWQALHEVALLKPGENILVHAGAGGVGGYAVQFAKNQGAKVFSTAGTKNQGFLKELGVDYPIDYTTKPFPQSVREVTKDGMDVVFDCVGGETLTQSYGLVKRGGRLVSIVDTPDKNLCEKLGIYGVFHFVRPDGAELTQISQALENEKVKALPVDERKLADAAEAHRESRKRHLRGKIVFKI